jgi:ketosteroid isomerase-like protein
MYRHALECSVKGEAMSPKTPEEICSLFRQYMAEGDLDALVNIYDREAAFLNESGEIRIGRQEIRRQLAPLAAARAGFDSEIRQVIRTGEIALMHTHWKVSGPQPRFVYAIEVAAASQTARGAG